MFEASAWRFKPLHVATLVGHHWPWDCPRIRLTPWCIRFPQSFGSTCPQCPQCPIIDFTHFYSFGHILVICGYIQSTSTTFHSFSSSIPQIHDPKIPKSHHIMRWSHPASHQKGLGPFWIWRHPSGASLVVIGLVIWRYLASLKWPYGLP
jgi:hypothetical protein